MTVVTMSEEADAGGSHESMLRIAVDGGWQYTGRER